MRKIIMYTVIALASLLLISNTYKLGLNSIKPTQIIKEVKVVDTELLNSFLKLQVEYDKLLTEYTTFENHLEVYERGFYSGYLKAKGIEAGE